MHYKSELDFRDLKHSSKFFTPFDEHVRSFKMWSPTHVQVTVQRARGLISRGHNGVFVTIGLGKEKYQTSVKERESEEIEWREKCELKIPSQGNTASIMLTVLTHNFLGVDNFLGCVNIPLADLDVYDRPKNKWYELQDRQGKPKTKDRGELEVKIGFSVQPGNGTDVNKRDPRRASLGQLSHAAQNVGGSLASITSVDKKSFKKLAKTITRKIKKDKKLQEEDVTSLNKHTISASKQAAGDADPGVISDEDEFAFDDLSHTGSGCSLEVAQMTSNNSQTGSIETVASSETFPTPSKENKFNTLPPSKPPRSITPIQEKFVHKWEQKLHEAKKSKALLNKSSERIVVGGEGKSVSPINSRLSPQILQQYENKSREDLIEMINDLQIKLSRADKDRKELEDYIDNLLLRVMEHSPSILQNPFL
ncbi:rab11 family-interacting protein 1 isoform X1 [Planococcus citri]|uniref:rab11 family-interacting protein 1 isoform X1 n=2 Tax=Planococcus citri TaxID=170843 RepID=UPI0031F87E8D